MVNSINSSTLATLFGSSSSDSVSADVLTAWAQAKAGIGVNVAAATADPKAPLAPVWTPGYTPGAASLIARANAGKAFFDTTAKLYSDLGATGDYKKLFALHTGLQTLSALAGQAGNDTLSKADLAKTLAQFTRGMTELSTFFTDQQFEDMRLAQGDRVDSAQTTLALPSKSEDYQTGIIHKGSLSTTISGLDKNAKFDIVATSAGGAVRTVSIDLSQMGSLPRSLSNVISFVNGKLSAAGASSRLEAVDQTPKTSTIVVGGKVTQTKYTGSKQYALKVDVRAGEKVAFQPVNPEPAFYVLGDVGTGAHLIKLADVGGDAGQTTWLDRPASTTDPIGADVATGWYGAGPPYTTAPAGAYETRTNVVMTNGSSNLEDAIRDSGEAVIKLQFPDGRVMSVSTAWRADDLEAWRTRTGEDSDRAIMDDLAERLTQLMHEQGVAAGVDVWEDNGHLGFSVFTGDDVKVSSLTVGGRAATLDVTAPSGMVDGLRDGVFARRFETQAVGGASDLFIGDQTFTFTTSTGTQTITIDGGDDGIDATELISQLNDEIATKGIRASASLVDNSGVLSLRVDALHDMLDVAATLNEDTYDADLQAPGAWANGGLPVASAGQPYGDAVRTTTVAGSPLSNYPGAIDLQIVVATPTGNKTVSVNVSALERGNSPDSGGDWSSIFQSRLETALNAAGVYVGANGADLTSWSTAEGSGQRIASISINGNALSLSDTAPSGGVGGAFSVERSFTSAQAATGVSDDIAALLTDQSVSISFNTVWGQKTVSASLQPGDPATLESVAMRLNEALSAQGYDVGVEATALSGGGAGLRLVTGASHTVRGISGVSIGGQAAGVTLDPIDSASHTDDPNGAARVADRATRGASVSEVYAAASTYIAPSANATGWFAGRAFDVTVGGGAKVATARSVATGADGAVYVLADLSADTANLAIKGDRDVALFKYDSAGKLVFTEVLGASKAANGFSLAVSSDGKVAVAGSVEGGLTGAGAEKGGTDSFVTLFDATGKELWTARRGATANDQINAISFAPNGNIVVAGQTDSALGPALALGGTDGYVRAFSAAGAELFTRQFGTTGADAATALLVRDDGAGGMEIFTGGVEDNRGVLRRFSYASGAGLTVGATRDIGYFYKGAINAIAADGSSLYVGGGVGADRVTVGATAHASVAGQEGFVARLDSGLVSTALDRTSYVGSAKDDSVRGLAVVNGYVYASGVTGGLMSGLGTSNARSAFLTRLDSSGDTEWTRTFLSSSGVLDVHGMAVDQSGVSPLDILGLPRGTIAAADNNTLTTRSALRTDDEFQIGIEGRRLSTIKIGKDDTMATLVATINRAIGSAGRAQIVKEDGVERIKITARDGKALRIEPGRAGKDALPALGLSQGVIAVNSTTRGSLKTYGLGLIASDLKLDTKANIAKTKAEISAAISIVKQAYDALVNPNAKPQTDEEKALAAKKAAAGAAPEYYSQQLANYKAALSRLGG